MGSDYFMEYQRGPGAQAEDRRNRERIVALEAELAEAKRQRDELVVAQATTLADLATVAKRAERAESTLAASESRAAWLAAALADVHSRCLPGPIQRVCEDAIAASSLECVPGHLIPTSHGWSWEPNATGERPGWLVYHKEKQHG